MEGKLLRHQITVPAEGAVQKAAPDRRQQDDEDDPLILHHAEVDALGQHSQQDAAAVQRRHRDEVEHGEAHIQIH